MILIAGPCSLEGEEMAKKHSYELANLADKYGYDFYFKASFDKANRTSIYSERGIGMERAAEIFDKLETKITTDVHEPHQVGYMMNHIDMIQIPAFLCRQTDLLITSGLSGLPVNIKKGQMVNGRDMHYAKEKVGHENVLLTERGSMFGSNDLVVDFRQIIDMKQHAPVIMDCTHSTTPEYSLHLAKAAKAVEVQGLFFEVHENPEKAWSDGSKSIPLKEFESFLKQL